jgi:hypothetical protein
MSGYQLLDSRLRGNDNFRIVSACLNQIVAVPGSATVR